MMWWGELIFVCLYVYACTHMYIHIYVHVYMQLCIHVVTKQKATVTSLEMNFIKEMDILCFCITDAWASITGNHGSLVARPKLPKIHHICKWDLSFVVPLSLPIHLKYSKP